ncbi:MAG: hypothetical protein KBT35_02130 [Firmicutes bacterium]|nr:hypothetical protein [Candidatus Colivicinus equi]
MKLIDLLEEARNSTANLALQYDAYNLLYSKNIKDFLNDNNKDECVKFMLSAMESYVKNDISKDIIIPNKERANHCVITWLLGIGINNRLNILKKRRLSDALWTQTAAIHDYGYFSEYTKHNDTILSKIGTKYDLLTDKYNDDLLLCLNDMSVKKNELFSYNYFEIKQYFEYSKFLHREIIGEDYSHEMCDHGIIGACLIFDKYCRQIYKEKKNIIPITPDNDITKVQKIAAITIASHNIFKNSKKDNPTWKKQNKKLKMLGLDKLMTNSKYKIAKDNELLSLLSLVDTIECYKKFRRDETRSMVNTNTILDTIDISFSNKKEIIFDMSEFVKKTNRNENKDEIIEKTTSHIKSICNMKDWTSFKTKQISDYCVKIRWIS